MLAYIHPLQGGFGHPDNSLPGGGHPDNSLPGGGHPDQGLPPFPPEISNDLPDPVWPGVPVYPDNDLPLPPGHIYPPLPPSISGKALVLVFVYGVGRRWLVVNVPQPK